MRFCRIQFYWCCDLFYTVTVFSMLNFIRNVLFSSLALPWVMASCHFCCALPLLWSCHMFCNPRETILFERSFVANLVFQVFLALVRERQYARKRFLPSWLSHQILLPRSHHSSGEGHPASSTFLPDFYVIGEGWIPVGMDSSKPIQCNWIFIAWQKQSRIA